MGGASCREHASLCQPAPTSDLPVPTPITHLDLSRASPPVFPCRDQFVFLDRVSFWGPGPNWPGGGGSFAIQLGHRSRAVSWAAILGAV